MKKYKLSKLIDKTEKTDKAWINFPIDSNENIKIEGSHYDKFITLSYYHDCGWCGYRLYFGDGDKIIEAETSSIQDFTKGYCEKMLEGFELFEQFIDINN